MKVAQTKLPGVFIVKPDVFYDQRGFFYESYNAKILAKETGIKERFVQDNHVHSVKNVLRGLHYQIKQTQGKLVTVTSGKVFDVIVDIRRSSSTFGQWVGTPLSSKDKKLLWIPPGFAHGYLVLSKEADFLYKTTDYYAPRYERCILWNDPDLSIKWPLKGQPLLSDKDKTGRLLRDAEVFE